jgi:hypothetical protein
MTQGILYPLKDLPPGMVAIPAVDWMWTDSAVAFIQLTRGMPPRSLLLVGRQCSSITWNRNDLTEDFLGDRSFEWILYLDSDMVPPVATIARLLSHQVDVVGALYYARQRPFMTEFSPLPEEHETFLDKPFQGLREVEWVGAGCLLVRRHVLDRIPFPWWESPVPGRDEDVLFCKKLRQLGFKIWLDCDLVIGHMTAQPIDRTNAQLFHHTDHGREMLSRTTTGSANYLSSSERTEAAALSRLEQGVGSKSESGGGVL